MAFRKTLTGIGMGVALLSQTGIATAQTTSAARLSVVNAVPANARVGASVKHGNHFLGGSALLVAGIAAAVAIAAIIVATDDNNNNNAVSR